jgi:hypothetical protein
MKQSIAVAVVVGALCNASFAVILFTIDAPQDEMAARAWACSRPEVKPLRVAYTNLVQTRLWPVKLGEMAKIFGPKLETATNWWGTSSTNGIGEHSGPALAHHPADLVLPMLATPGGTNCGGALMLMVSGLHSNDPAKNKSHTDLYAVGDIGYVELYSHPDGEKVQTAVIYFRWDFAFIPLASTNDFSARLEWERNKFDALNEWFDGHLGPVEKTGKPFPDATQSTK